MDYGSIINATERRTAEGHNLVEQIKQLAERQINVIQVSASIGVDGKTERWAIVEFSIGNGKWTKFPIKNNFEYASDFIKYIIEVVHQIREEMSFKH